MDRVIAAHGGCVANTELVSWMLSMGRDIFEVSGGITYVERIEEDGSCIPYGPGQYDVDD